MNIFHREIKFTNHDPLDDGLAEEIAREQREPEAFETLDDIDGEDLSLSWEQISTDAEKDAWYVFEEDN